MHAHVPLHVSTVETHERHALALNHILRRRLATLLTSVLVSLPVKSKGPGT